MDAKNLAPPMRNLSMELECFSLNMMTMSGIWLGEKPYLYSFPLFFIQILLIITTTNAIHFILQRLNLPRYISETIGGFILGPSALGKNPKFVEMFFPERSVIMLESFAFMGLIYYLFTVSVQIDLTSKLRRASMRRVWFALACIAPPFILGILSGFPIHEMLEENSKPVPFVLFISVSLSVTAFSMLVHNIANLKLAGAELGKLVISVAIIVDGFAWVGLSIVVALSSESTTRKLASLFTISSGYGIYISVHLFLPLLLNRFCKQVVEGTEEPGELLECVILVGVLISAFLGDFVGENVVFGAFVYGLAIPHGPLGLRLVERVDEIVRRMLLPLFFAICGLRINVYLVNNVRVVMSFVVLVMVSGALRIVGGVIVAVAHSMHWHDGVSFGFLMNTKGIIELILLNVAMSKKIIGDQCFTIMTIISIAQTAFVGLLLTSVIKPARGLVHYKRRTVKWHDSGSMMRIVTCVHHPRDVQTLISLVDSTCPTKRTPVSVSVVQLVELTCRTSTVLLLNNGQLSNSNYNIPLHAQFASVSRAFESYEQDVDGMCTQSSTALSPYDTMHDDVITAANDHHAALLLLPFHMHQAVDGVLELTSHPSVRSVNERVLHASPCTVAIIIDRGLGGFTHCASILRVVVLFFGGPDDCESLALASRMANHSAIELSVVQFLPKNTEMNGTQRDEMELREQYVDEEYMREIRERSSDEGVVDYRKVVVTNAEETLEAIRMIAVERKDLFIVGKGQGMTGSRLTAGMIEWSEFRELGPIGDLLVSDDFGSTASVVVVQAPRPTLGLGDTSVVTISSVPQKEEVKISMDQT